MKITPYATGMLMAAAAFFFFTCFDAATRYAASHTPVLQITAIELIFAALLLVVWTWLEKRENFRQVLRFEKKKLHLARGILNGISNMLFFIGFLHMQLAEFYVLLFLCPVWVAILSAVFLREKATPALIISIVLSFVGVVIALRPAEGISIWALMVLAGTFTNAIALIVLRRMTKTESNMATAVSVCFIMGVTILIPALFNLKVPDTTSILCMLIGGTSFAVAQRFLIKACELAPAPIACAAQFLQLIYGALAGYLVFGDVPSLWIYIGGAIVVAANLYLLYTQNKFKPS